MTRLWNRTIALGAAAAMLLSGCGASTGAQSAVNDTSAVQAASADDTDLVEIMELTEEEIPLADAPKSSMLLPQASGTKVQSNAKAAIDYSNTADGYVMVKYTASTSQKLKVIVKGPKTTYTYNLAADKAWDTYPLSDGSGAYTIGVYENVSGTKYAGVLSQSISVTLKDEFAPFVRPNQYVDYENAPKTVAKAAELVSGKTRELDKVQAVYDFVVKNIKYDKQLAATVKSGYLPVLDTVLEKKTGICFDYAALMAGMLRSQGIPCKLVVGYAGQTYHAWISVYTEENGWVEGVVYFDGTSWQRMDPTFASTGNQSSTVMQYIGDGRNYTVKYLY